MRRVLALILLAACGSAPPGEVDDCSRDLSLPGRVSTDILFVIDNSGSMEEEQARIAEELGTFVSVLLDSAVENDFQVGVITTDVTRNTLSCSGDETRFRAFEQAGILQTAKNLDGQILDPDGPRILRHDDPGFLTKFAALVGQGIVGSGQEMPLEAVRRALAAPENEGFLRPRARLLVVIVTDEDDCSDPTGTALALEPRCGDEPTCSSDADCGGEGIYCLPDGQERRCIPNTCDTAAGRAALAPVSTYVDFLRRLDDGDGGRREVSLAVIGPVDPSDLSPARCRSATDEAQGTGVRLGEAARAFGDAGLLASICSPSYGASLRDAAELVAAPHSIWLSDAPADGRLLLVEIERGDDAILCRLGDGFSYERDGTDARVTLEGRCRLQPGDRVTSRLFCAG